VGTSRFGGLPDLPSDLAWPQWNEHPIPLLAQINLADIAAYDVQDELPHTGMLYIFFEENAFEDYPPAVGSWRVLYRAEPDKDLCCAPMQLEEKRVYPPHALQIASRLLLPPFESAQMQALGFSYTAFQDASPEKRREADAYGEMLESLDGDIAVHHQLLGYPCQIQGDLLQECKRDTEWQGESTDWQLLLQIDSDDSIDMVWGDVGVLYFYIPTQALQVCDFPQVHLLMQCY
jgi:uncharacterized protein YwqG